MLVQARCRKMIKIIINPEIRDEHIKRWPAMFMFMVKELFGQWCAGSLIS